MIGLYREPPRQPRFVCLSCEAQDPWPGACPSCQVERLPLSDGRVREELAAARERRLQARAGHEQRLLGIGVFLATSPLTSLGGWPIGLLVWFGAAVAGTVVAWRLAARHPRSALHVFRRRRAAD